jgi:hypothetical protein
MREQVSKNGNSTWILKREIIHLAGDPAKLQWKSIGFVVSVHGILPRKRPKEETVSEADA